MYVSRLRRRTPLDRMKREDLAARLVTVMNPADPSSEAYRALRTSLLYAFVDSPPKVITITSPGRSEGKTITCANLGVAMAQIENNTLIVDCDLRKPEMHRVFGLRNLYGIVNVLMEEYSLQEVCHEPFPGLKVLTVGSVPPNPAELLGSRRFRGLMDQARQQFDYVFIDTPPTQAVSDPTIIARHTDGVLLILDAQKTRKNSVRQGIRSLQANGIEVLGTVTNNIKVSEKHMRRPYL
jgi:capsular exopolysaccharide synthesis family protein